MSTTFAPTKYQQAIYDEVKNGSGDIMIEAVAGSGKCLGAGTPVMLYGGRILPVEEIQVGDMLMGPDSTPRKVLSTTDGDDMLYRIIPVKGESWVCNSAHVLTLTGTNRNNGRTIDIPLNEYLTRCAEYSSFAQDWKLFRVGVDFPALEEKLPVDPYLVGLWLGDGHTSGATWTNMDQEVLDYLADAAVAYGATLRHVGMTGLAHTLSFSWLRNDDSGKKYYGKMLSRPVTLRSFFRDQCRNELGQKMIPQHYLVSSREERLLLLAGIIDTDGSLGGGYFEVTSKYEHLADQYAFLARSLGFSAYKAKKMVLAGKRGLTPYWRVSISGDVSQIPVRIPRKQASQRKQIKRVTVTGFTVEEIGQGKYFGFTLDSDGRFLLGDFTVTHNTTTLVEIARMLAGNVRAAFFAFNKHIATEIGEKLTFTTVLNGKKVEHKLPFSCSTIHAYGWKTVSNAVYGQSKGKVKKVVTKGDKYQNLADEFIKMTLNPQERHRLMVDATFEQKITQRVKALNELVNMVRSTLTQGTDTAGIAALMIRYDITLDPKDTEDGEEQVMKGVVPVIRRGIQLYRERGLIDFTDMIFLPYALDMVPEKFDWVLVDEAQDLNAAQRWLVQQGRANGGRMIFVGDSRQAIMGFAGADTSSFFKIQQETEATMLPLSICWRCPSTHLNMARLIVPSIEDRPNAPEGTIAAIHEASATKAIQEAVTKSQEGGVLVLSRTTAPLVGLCIKLIKSRVAARVRGRDIAKGLVELAQTCGKMTGIDFLDALELHERKQVEKLSRKPGNENRIDTLHDKCEALQVCWTEFNVSTVAELCREIENIFSDERPTVWLSTIHRAKGLEAEQVFIVNPSKLPFTHPKQGPEDAVQEANICYVALTRSTNSMTFIFQDEEEVPENYMDYIAL